VLVFTIGPRAIPQAGFRADDQAERFIVVERAMAEIVFAVFLQVHTPVFRRTRETSRFTRSITSSASLAMPVTLQNPVKNFIDAFYALRDIRYKYFRFAQLNKYECGMHIPPIEKLIQLSDILGVTLDCLVIGNRDQIQPLHNVRLIGRLQELERFDSDDQETIIKMIDAMIVKGRVEGAVAPIDRQRANG